MARRIRKNPWTRSLQRNLDALTRSALRAGTKALKQAIGATPVVKSVAAANRSAVARVRRRASTAAAERWITGVAMAAGGVRHYRVYRPAGIRHSERLPLLVMLHGCGQHAEELAAISRMNRVADRERFLVLYAEQDRLHNSQGCWNWFETRSGKAQIEAAIIDAAIDQVCLRQPVDPARIALAGLSAGAGMAALMAVRRPGRYRAVAMHSGVAPGVAHSTTTALGAMQGRRSTAVLAPEHHSAATWPALLVIHGSADRVVAASNGATAVQLWASRVHAAARPPRTVQRGARHPATVTDYRTRDGSVVATRCEIDGLGHAWSGGAAGRYSDPQGPDASRMIWRFCAKQFAAAAR